MDAPTHLDTTAALLTVRLLQASFLPMKAKLKYRVGDSDELLSEGQVVEALAVAPKPLWCEADALEGKLVVRTASLSTGEQLAKYRYQVSTNENTDSTYGSLIALQNTRPAARILVIFPGTTLECTSEAIRRWRTDYVVNCDYVAALRLVESDGSASGVVAELDFS